jgi:hypothetical protein
MDPMGETSRCRSCCPVVVVAGTSSGVGKTTIAVGLMHTLTQQGLRVQPFKVGPDFLDGLQHEVATGVPSINLDGWMMGRSGCLSAFCAAVASTAADIAVVEGCMGLHDGRDGCSDEGSTAQVAKWLGAPVLLVVDAWNLARSAAAMVHGYRTFDHAVRLRGVVLNRVAGTAHAEWCVLPCRRLAALRAACAAAPVAVGTNTAIACHSAVSAALRMMGGWGVTLGVAAGSGRRWRPRPAPPTCLCWAVSLPTSDWQ